jgi:hypothetical protein
MGQPASPGSPSGVLRSFARGFLLAALAAMPFLASLPEVLAQDLVGCQLVDGSLQCVPGINADPQKQIRILRREIAADQSLEGAVEQRIDALGTLLLKGEAREGTLLRASLSAEALAGLPPTAFHWYRHAPSRNRWELIEGARGPTYLLGSGDVAWEVMVVVAVPTPQGSRRMASAPVGPVRAKTAGAP